MKKEVGKSPRSCDLRISLPSVSRYNDPLDIDSFRFRSFVQGEVEKVNNFFEGVIFCNLFPNVQAKVAEAEKKLSVLSHQLHVFLAHPQSVNLFV